MAGRQRILPVRREYNRWVANQTLEDYALRFTAKSARRWSAPRVAQTAIGAISFLALEAIGGAITLSYGFTNAVSAILVVSVILFLTALPISRYAARYGVDIDLLTRGAGFGYIGSTITSLIYASFTFILFAIEASIMSSALELCFGVPLWLGYILSSIAVIPLVTHGITWISRFQLATQPLWIFLNLLPVAFILWKDWPAVTEWLGFAGIHDIAPGTRGTEFDILRFGAAASVILALMPQIGEQVDILRFLPVLEKTAKKSERNAWARALLAAGPGWVILGVPKLLFGSFLAVLAVGHGVAQDHAIEPAYMYRVAFDYVFPNETIVLAVTVILVVVSQLKINVMNAYAGSLAWSNFFSRLTHSHPGRVVWLIFNVAIALLLMELGIYKTLEATLGLFAIIAVAWLGTVTADLAVNKPLGFSPPGIEFKRAHLYDVNPVGVGAMTLATLMALIAHAGWFGDIAEALSPFVALAVAFVAAPAIAWASKGRYYLARKPRANWRLKPTMECRICQHDFEPEDMAFCPAYSAPICSLCCSLDARCHDLCKPKARLEAQVEISLARFLPDWLLGRGHSRLGTYFGILSLLASVIGVILAFIYLQATNGGEVNDEIVGPALWSAFFTLLIVAGITAWFFVLAHESRRVAQEESARQTTALLNEIEAHRKTDAKLQKAKEAAEAANRAKSRYVVGLSHELRTPLNAVLGYAQILERDKGIPAGRRAGVEVIKRSAEHLSGLIDGLLDVSRIEAGRLQLQRNEVRISDFLAQIVDMFRLQAAAKGLEFIFDRSPILPEVVRTDEKRLRQILINLITNAIKFTDKGSVRLAVTYRSQIATIVVEDSGVGIDETDLARIFDPFERVTPKEGPAPIGLGLGLTITKLLADLMGGDITVTSTPGKGSRFTVRLMLSAVDAPDALPPPREAITGYIGERRMIMVVDDDAAHRELMTEILKPLGFAVLTARSGEECLAIGPAIRPDLFLLDIAMPGMNGWALARALRRGGHDRTKIIMMSANLGDGQLGPASETTEADDDVALHDDVLPKPFDLDTLLEKIRSHLKLDWEGTRLARPEEIDAPPAEGELANGHRGQQFLHEADRQELIRLGGIGYVRGIEARLDRLEEDAALKPLIEELRGHVRNFDFGRYLAVLETAGRGNDTHG
ncbi:Aerobic respiration control sensor protein ArcB [Hartmannibacter diazotrophicus]|uniref:histidine kinase n=1 Tax=Hartmannibacter diazotrophicus TaxID=1482074 RepID=A0A2C9D1Q9_9HYPH|nr:ATP-binding protein [Hartmannibacter diazotrophicus]SON54180.1 Aerobic respiration control sensor protein ArcB [Hartmannibacter diazotrophicus]